MPYKDTEKHKAYQNEYQARCRKENRDLIRERKRAWEAANPDRINAYRERKKAYSATIAAKEAKKRWWAENGHRIYQRHQAKYFDYKSLVKEFYGCQNPDCPLGLEVPAICLDFHHVDESQKAFNIGAGRKPKDKLVEEMSKCTVICAVCHRMETYGELDASGFRTCTFDDEGNPT